MGFFGSGDKLTSNSATQTGVSDDGLNVGGAGGAAARDSATSIATSGAFNTTKIGSTEVGTIASNSLFNSTNTGTINNGYGSEEVTKLLSDTTGKIADLVKQQSDAAKGQVSEVVTGLQDLALSKQTDGQSVTSKTFLYIALGVLGLFALFVWKK